MEMNPVVRISKRFDEGNDEALIVQGKEKFLYDSNGKKYIDYCGGIWNIPFGYSCPEIIENVVKQYNKLPFCNLCIQVSDIQHDYAVRLNNELGTTSLLYTCSGSESIEAAIKVCRKYQSMKKSNRKTIAVFNMSYHGTSYGAMSVSGIDRIITDDYNPMLSGINWIVIPVDAIDNENEWIRIIDQHFEQYATELAGVIYEPIFGSGGIIPFPIKALKRLEELCKEHDVLLVDDEVTTGFGRTGVSFAFQSSGIKPDLICLSKGITNGFLPLGVLAFSKEVCTTFVEKNESLEHFSTQGGNLLSVAAADVVLDYMKEYETYQVAEKGEYFKEYLQELFAPYKQIEVRGQGLMIGIQFPLNSDIRNVEKVWEKLKKKGVITYIFQNYEYNHGLSFFPPYISTKEELKDIADKVLYVLRRFPDILK